jgi:iron complex transport system substrate-binding protein
LTLNPTGLNDILADVERIGGATGREPEARTLAATLRARLQSVHEQIATAQERPTVVCLEWLDPLYAAGHWVPEMVAWAGQTRSGQTAPRPNRSPGNRSSPLRRTSW